MNPPLLLLAKPVAESIRAEVKERVRAFVARHGRTPKLSVVLVGEDPASVIYTTRKGEAAIAAGMEHETLRFPATATPEEVHAQVSRLNADPTVDGILIQRPSGGLPRGYKEEEVLYWVSPSKDVDAFHPENLGRLALGLPSFAPCTPAGVMEILKHYGISVAGKLVCVIGRSSIVGKPMAMLLLRADATVLHGHSKTPDLRAIARQADIIVAAIGKARYIDSSFLREGAVVIDVGINRLASGPDAGKVVGDADFADCSKRASAITPVPGGVGPMTISVLLRNTILAAERRTEPAFPARV